MDSIEPNSNGHKETAHFVLQGKGGVGRRYISAIPGASSFNLLVNYPTGATATVHCAASPCLAAFDQSQGNRSMQIQYLSASGTALATQPYPFAISVN